MDAFGLPIFYYDCHIHYTNRTEKILNRLADLKPKMIAPMHGATYVGDGKAAIHDLARAMKEVLALP